MRNKIVHIDVTLLISGVEYLINSSIISFINTTLNSENSQIPI